MRPALWSVAIQATGSAATVLAALLVATQLGLPAQGEFGLLRSWSDAAVTLAVLGFPQGLLHLQYRAGVTVAALRPWVARYAAGVAAAVALVAAVAWAAWPASAALPRMPLLVAAAAVPLAAAHLLWRALALRDVGIVPYAVLTAAPAVLVLVALVPVCVAGWHGGLAWALFASAALSAGVSWALVRRAVRQPAPRPDSGTPWPRRALWAVSLETGGQNVLTALTPAMVLSTAGLSGGPLAQLGMVSLGLQVYQLFGVAAAYVAPLVYDRAARAQVPLGGRALVALLQAQATPRVRLAAVLMGGAVAVVLPLLWPPGAASLLLVAAMALAGLLSMAVRLISTLLLARGAFRALTFNALGRLAIATGVTALLMAFQPPSVAVPLALVATEAALLLWLLRVMAQGATAAPPPDQGHADAGHAPR